MNRHSIKKYREPVTTTFVVEGVLAFPLDMLRYDSAYPATELDALAIARSLSDDGDLARLRVTLKTPRGPYLTPARWRSFRWTIVEVDGERVALAQA